MFRRQIAFAIVICCLVPATVRAGVVELIPDDALGYLLVNRINETDEKIGAMGKRMNLPIPRFTPLLKTQCGIERGFDESGSIALALLPSSAGPAPLLFVPVKNYDEFLEQLDESSVENNVTKGRLQGREVLVGKKENHAVIALAEHLELLHQTLSRKATKETTDVIKSLETDHDIAAVISTSGVKLLTALGQQGLKTVREIVRKQVGDDNPALAGIEVYIQILEFVGSEVSAGALGVKLEGDGSFRLNEWVWVEPKGTIAPILRSIQPHDGDLLAALPKTPYVMAVGGIVPKGAMEPMLAFSGKTMKSLPQLYGLSPEQVDKMLELSEEFFPDVRGMSFILGVGQEGTPLYSEMLAAMHVRDAAKYLADYRKFWVELEKAIGDAEDSFLHGIKLEDIEVDGAGVLKITMPIPGLKNLNLPNKDEVESLMEKFYGPGGITLYLAATDKETVIIAYTETTLLSKVLQMKTGETKSISQDEDLVHTSKKLPRGAHLVGYWNPNGTITFGSRMMRLAGGEENGFQFGPLPDALPAGFAMKVTPSVIQFNTVVPGETIKAVGSMFEKLSPADE